MPMTDAWDEWTPFWAFNMNSPSEGARQLADSFESVARLETLPKEPKDWISVTAQSNKDSLGAELPKYAAILDKIGETLLKKAQNGELTTPEEHRALWLEIASGLRKV